MTNPISRTAYYTLGVRAWDAAQPKPVCGDSLAKLFMNDDAQKVWQEFKGDLRPNASNASRHAIIDGQVREALRATPDSRVVIIGAGFDTRAFRIKGGNWIEVDEPQIIGLKESVLPASKASNPLRRIPIEFAKELLTEKLSAFTTTQTTHIIIEGVFMYLHQNERQGLLTALQKIFPNQVVYCDLIRQSFFERYSKPLHQKLLSLGASFTEITEHPENIFLENGYKILAYTSIPLHAAQHVKLGIPAFLIRFFLKTLRKGFCVWRFRVDQN
jgi:methyltransferase (TIGR00027 family)